MKAMSCSSGSMSECFLTVSVSVICRHQVHLLYASLAPLPPLNPTCCPSNCACMCAESETFKCPARI